MTYDSANSVSCADIIGQTDDVCTEDDKEDDKEECGLSSGEPLDSVNGKPETDDKENNNGISTDETQAVRYGNRRDNGQCC